MLYLSSYFGRTVSNVAIENKHTVFKFSDFSMIFLSKLDASHGMFSEFVGQKFLYVQKHDNLVYFHFSNSLHFSVKVDSNEESFPHYIMLKNKDKEVLLRIDDGKTFEGV